MRRTFWLAALLTVGCGTASPPPPAPAPSVAPTPSPAPPNDVHWAMTSAEHRAVYLQIYALATRRVEEMAPGLQAGTWAVELDADETVLDNAQYQRELAAKNAKFSRETWRAWVERRAATALPGSKAFLDRVRELGGKIAIVTNRDQAECPATHDNFSSQNLAFDLILCKESTSDKNPRFAAIENGTAAPPLPPLRIVTYLGDNIQDFPDLSQDIRDDADTAFADFGTRFFVLPNSMYGSWEKNPAN
jgi:5'-nucleotidase (lipoprotein e(P4) family)